MKHYQYEKYPKTLKYFVYNTKTGKIKKTEGHDNAEDLKEHIVVAQFIENLK